MALDASKIVLLRKSAIKVFLVAGQSNVLRGDPITQADRDTVTELFQPVYDLPSGQRYVNSGEPLNHPIPDDTKIGFAVEFARQYLAENPGDTVLLVPAGKGTTGFAPPGEWLVGGDSYNEAISRCIGVVESFSNATFEGVLWHQGEFDANAGVAEATYAGQLDGMIVGMRADIPGAADTPFLVGQMFVDLVAAEPQRQGVQDAITDTPNRVTDSEVAIATGLTSYDNLHFDRASMLTLGGLYYQNYKTVIGA